MEYRTIWKDGMLFTWQWWLLLALAVLPWVAWCFRRKKDSTNRLLYVGFFSILVAKLLDTIGANFELWNYPLKLIPLMPPFFPWDTTMMPVAVMAFIQYKPSIKPAIKAVVFAAIAAFVIEPLAEWLGLYRPILWKHFYSFPFYFVIYMAADWLSRRGHFERINQK